MLSLFNINGLAPSSSKASTISKINGLTCNPEESTISSAYDKDALETTGATKRKVKLTAEKLNRLKQALIVKGEATNILGVERAKNSVDAIVGNIMQSFNEQELYPTVEEKAAHLLCFMVKNHPFIDGNKRSGAYAFVWFLRQGKILDNT